MNNTWQLICYKCGYKTISSSEMLKHIEHEHPEYIR